MTRACKDWLQAYLQYTAGTEAPRIMHFFAGVSAIAGALRRKVWIDLVRFKWYPSFYIVFVADPGIVSKSTTADLSMSLLREVPGIKFGPDSVTWQSLVTSFAGACESFEYGGLWYPMSPLTLLASEFGSLMNLADQDMVNLFITLWDGRDRYDKQTKMSGNDTVEAPWINLLACTTPSWMATNMSQLALAGGLTSRTIYIFGEAKENLVAYPHRNAPQDVQSLKSALIHDLEHISLNLTGPMKLTREAEAWGEAWYEKLWKADYKADLPDWHKGYLARKQTHLHKLAMIVSISHSDSLEITLEDLQLANVMLESLEPDLEKVFSKVGKSVEAVEASRLIDYIKRRGSCPYQDAYRMMHSAFPNFKDFEGIIAGAVRSGLVKADARGPAASDIWLTYQGE